MTHDRAADRVNALWTDAVVDALRGYQAARAYLFSFDRFEDVPLKGESRLQPPAADNLLFLREKAPEFGALLRAFSQ